MPAHNDEELDRVRLGPVVAQAQDGSSSDEDDDSDPESAPTDEDPDLDRSYEVDAIKWAKYRDSRRDRQDGYIGWHYGVMWKGYLKIGSETEEPLASFEVEQGGTPLVDEFWKAVGKPIRKGRKEPKGVLGEVVEAPKALMKNWLKQCRPRRDYATFVRRRAKELDREKRERQGLSTDHLLITKVDSDYYWNKKRKRDIRRRREAAGRFPPGDRPPTARAVSRAGSSSRRAETAPAVLPVTAAAVASLRERSASPVQSDQMTTNDVPVTLGSPASSLGSIFNSEEEDVSMDLDAVSEEEQEQIEIPPTATEREKGKRKHEVISSPLQGPSEAGPSISRDVKKTKKAKIDNDVDKDTTPSGAPSRLAGIGKIPKRIVVSPPPAASPQLSFGQLEPGIFDPALAGSSSAENNIPDPTTMARLASPTSAVSAVEIHRPDSATTLNAATSADPSVPMTETTSIATASDKQVHAVSSRLSPSLPQNPKLDVITQNNDSNSPMTEQMPPTPAMTPLPPSGPLPPPPPPLAGPATPALTAVVTPVDPRVNRAALLSSQSHMISVRPPVSQPAAVVRGHPSPPLTAGPVPSFNPAPVSQARPVPPHANRPKYVQPSRIQIAPSRVDPESAKRLARVGINDTHIVPQPPSGQTGLPSRPKSSAFVPRQQHPQALAVTHQPPLGPRADRMVEGSHSYGWKAPVLLPDQKLVYRAEIVPRQQQQQFYEENNGSMSPNSWIAVPSGHVSPGPNVMQHPPISGHISPRIDSASPPMPSAQFIPQNLPKDPRLRLKQTSGAVSPAESSAPLPTVTPNAVPLTTASTSNLGPVNSQGGLVTFSPRLILHGPSELAQVMKLMQTSTTWGAYIIPSVLDLVGKSWASAHLCPDPTHAYSVLHEFLNLDNRLRRFSSSAITAGGGLTVTCCPPSPYNAAACANWKAWVDKISLESDYMELTKLCNGIVPGFFEKQAQAQKNGGTVAVETNSPLSAKDVEIAQVDDMRAMRMRKDVANYSSFVYVGEEELSQEKKLAIGAEIEFLTADQFITMLNMT